VLLSLYLSPFVSTAASQTFIVCAFAGPALSEESAAHQVTRNSVVVNSGKFTRDKYTETFDARCNALLERTSKKLSLPCDPQPLLESLAL